MTTLAPPVEQQKRTKTIVGTGVGNALEWFDWNIYAIFATFFAAQFFSGENRVSALLATLAVFAVGFVARPFGGFLFGWISDRRGRRAAMTLSVALAAGGSFAIGLSPTYESIGIGASLILLTARLVQGLAHGGELPSAQTYLSEVAPRQKRGLWASLIYVSGTMGVIVGTGMAAILTAVLDDQQMAAWGWRIPFVLGGFFGLYALVMRRRLDETEAFEREVGHQPAAPAESMWTAIVRHRTQALQVIGMTVGVTIVYYAWAISAPQYAISSRGIDPGSALWAGVVASLVFIATLPVWGAVSDRVGRRPVLLGCVLGLAASVFPLNALVGDSAVRLGVAMSLALVLIAGPAAIVPAVYAELFPTRIRTVGVGVPYSIAVATFGGTAPYLQTWLGGTFGPSWFNGYVIVMLLISAVAIASVPETRGRDLSGMH